MRITKLAFLAVAVLAACNGDGNNPTDAGRDAVIVDAPEFAPSITGLVASVTQLPSGVATPVTFTWTYLVEPTFPDPVCTMDNGIGPVMRGVPVNVTITQLTVVTLTCTNRAGMATRQVILSVPPVAPALATFTVSPTSVTAGVATPLTFTWTYSNVPSPAPTCTLDNGTTPITSGTPVTGITLTQARTFRLRCTNTQGTVFSGGTAPDVLVQANECGTAYAQCDPHATCTDTPNGYTCACNANYQGDGDTCSALVTDCSAAGNPALCDTNATCVGTTLCSCKAGYVGSGAAGDCTKLRGTFVTSAVGPAVLSSTGWTGATGTGLAAADSFCQLKAQNAGLTNYANYIAWMSDSTHDAFCRVQGLPGTKATNCGQGSLTYQAGPWARVGDWKPALANLQSLTSATPVTYYAASTTEAGTELTPTFSSGQITDRVWTGTDATGQYVANATCGDWSVNTSGTGVVGEVWGGGTSWTATSTANASCTGSYHLRCVEKSTGGAFPPRHPQSMKKAFLTSVSGNGNFTTWPDNYGQGTTTASTQGQLAADAICQSRARYAGYANPSAYKAWLATYGYGTSPYGIAQKITNTALGYARPDGVVLGTSRADMLDNRLAAAWEETELNTYPAGSLDTGSVATNIGSYTTTGTYFRTEYYYQCYYNWTQGTTSYQFFPGRWDMLDGRSASVGGSINSISSLYYQNCDQPTRLYCVED